jgi:hypothetical protein
MRPAALAFTFALLTLTTAGQAQAPAPENGIDVKRLEMIVPLIQKDIEEKKLPGAVVLVGRGDDVVWRTTVGNRAIEPKV